MKAFTREELDWVEAEWIYHLHGRQAFLSGEDFRQIRVWESEGVPPELLVNAMDAFFQRRAKRPRPRTYVALSQLVKDVEKALRLREALLRAGPEPRPAPGWAEVREPLRADPKARAAHEAWTRLKACAPSPEAPGFLEHFDLEQAAFRELVGIAESALGPVAEDLRSQLRARLAEAKLEEGSALWGRAWKHHWARMVCTAWGLRP